MSDAAARTHKMPKRCAECDTWASFGFQAKKPTHCGEHKPDGAEDVVHRRCAEPGCVRQPAFGFVWKKPTHCKRHKPYGAEDVENRRCAEPGWWPSTWWC